jgi:hypothetical protein
MYDLTMPSGPMLSMGQEQDPQTDQQQQPRPSIIDRVLGKLYPEGAYGGLLPPNVLADERRMALRGAGFSLLAGAGPRPLNAPPHNFGADLQEALDPQAWEKHLADVAQTGMQINAMMKKQEDEKKFAQIMAANPPVPNETRQQFSDRLVRISAAAGQAGLVEHMKALGELGHTLTPAPRQTELLDPTKTPDGSVQLIDKQTGDVVKSWAAGEKPVWTAPEKAEKTLAYSKDYANEIAPAEGAIKAFKAFNAAPWGGPNDAIKLANALKVIVPSSGVTTEQILTGQAATMFGDMPIIGPLLRSFKDGKELDTGARTAIRDYVQSQIPNITASAKSILARHRARATSVGLDPDQTTHDVTAGESSMIPISDSDQSGFNAVTSAAKKRKPL